MKKTRKLRRSALRDQKRREYAAEMARLSPAERLRVGLEFSDFCLMLAAAGQKRVLKDLLQKWPQIT